MAPTETKKPAPKKSAAKKKTVRRKKQAAAKKAPAATKKVNKSSAIRDFMAANPNAGPKEVADTLSKQGIKVSPAFVSTIKALTKTVPHTY